MDRQGLVRVRLYRPPGPLGPALLAAKAFALPVARARRRRLRGRTTFVAVTGSAGKTTTTRLLDAALATRGAVAPRRRGPSQAWKLVKTASTAKRAHHACVLDLGLFAPGGMDELLWAYEPDVAVVTTIGLDHWRAFGSREAVAAEKAKVVAAVPRAGLAVLNADDPLVRAMAADARGRVVLYGTAPDADIRAEEVGVDAGGRLVLTLVSGGERHRVATRLQGEVWLTAVLAVLATAVSLGVPAADAVRAVAAVPPVRNRLSVLDAPGGVTYLRDDWKGSSWTVGPALDALAAVPARRRVAVLGELPDDERRPRAFYRDVVRDARARADLVVLVGQKARHGLKGDRKADPGVRHFAGVPEATAYLRGVVREGDVVLVKGNRLPEHLERVSLAAVVPVACDRVRCRKRVFCDDCRLLTRGMRRPRWSARSV